MGTIDNMDDHAMEDSDDEYELLSDLALSDNNSTFSEDEKNDFEAPQNTPATTPTSSSYHQDFSGDRKKKYFCMYENCAKAFNRPARLEEHIRSHTNNRVFECPYQGCSKTYLRKGHLKHHFKSTHTKVRDYSCSWEGCSKSFTTGTRLRNHLAVHQGHEKYRCRGFGDCNQTFRKKETLQRHIVAVHLGAKPFPCPSEDCDKAFDTAEHLRQHHRVNHDPFRYSCTICLDAIDIDTKLSDLGKQELRMSAFFHTWSQFQTHNHELHPPTCNLCNRSFPTNRAVTRHQELEHDIRDPKSTSKEHFTCGQCHKQYSSKNNLNQHVKKEHEKQRWSCAPGEATIEHGSGVFVLFPSGTDLAYMQGLNEQDPNNLEYHIVGCNQEFKRKSDLQRHILAIHWGNPAGTTKQQVRKVKNAKRKAAEQEESVEKKVRKIRKDAGIPKKNLSSDIFGTADTAHFSGLSSFPTSSLPFPAMTGYGPVPDITSPSLLTGDETLLGNEIFLPSVFPSSNAADSTLTPTTIAEYAPHDEANDSIDPRLLNLSD